MEDEGEGGRDDHSQSQLVLKEIRPFTIRADEFLNVDPKTSYYCRLHAVNIGVEKSKKFHRTLELTNALTEQLEHLERMKLNNEEFRDSLDHQLDALHVEKFAYTLFAKADAQDRKYKNRTKKIAKLYYVSANVFDVLRSMMSSTNDDDDDDGGGKEEGIDTATSPEIEEKQRYALWRAGEISKAIRLGVPCEDPPETSGKTTTTSRSESFKEDLDVDVDDERVEGRRREGRR
jgi:vacuolar protein sorting-associated protein VTA1